MSEIALEVASKIALYHGSPIAFKASWIRMIIGCSEFNLLAGVGSSFAPTY